MISAPPSYSACHSGAVPGLPPWMGPELKSGSCHIAIVHCFVLAERSARNHCSCAEPAFIGT